MRKKRQKRRNKPHFCFDVNAQFKLLNKECNQCGIFTSSIRLLKNERATDPEILAYCIKHDFHVITHNKHNFKDYTSATKLGIIYIGSQNPELWLNKFKSVMKKYLNHEDLYFMSINIIGNRVGEIDRRKILQLAEKIID